MLELIYGLPGSGKTTYLTGEIRRDVENGKRCFLLVPEQQAYISEMDFPKKLPPNAGLYFEIVTFSRLAEMVFAKYGGVTTGSVNNGIRLLLMWDSMRTLSSELTQYGKGARSDVKLSEMMLRTIDELRAAGTDFSKLDEIKIAEAPLLQKKLHDIAMVEENFSGTMRKLFGTDPSDKLLRMARMLDGKDFFDGCNVYIDSFTSFTAEEYKVIAQMIQHADHVAVSLCTDGLRSELPQFKSVVKTAKILGEMVNSEYSDHSLPPSKTKRPKTLQILERDLWRFDLKDNERTAPPMGESGVIEMTVCNNLYEESEAAALHILELVQNGMKYGDIAIIVRDIESYRGVIDATLERYGIPYFLSERTDLSTKPIARLILSALRAVDKHYRAQDIIALLKTGLTGVNLHDAALFEEYCNTWHINGSRFTEDVWSMNPDGLTVEKSDRGNAILEAANRVRKQLIDPLTHLAAEMRSAKSLLDRCRAVYNYMERLEIAKQLSNRAKKEMETSKRDAGETVRLYSFVTQTLADICTFLPDAEMTTEEFTTALSLVFSQTDLGSVPNVHDCVTVGSANMVRLEKNRASLLLGLCEGDFPQAISDDGMLSEQEKIILEAYDINLDSNEEMRSSEELLYAYRSMTKPLERLYLSTVTMQPDGSAKTPSLAFSRVQFLFPKLKAEIFDLDAVLQALGKTTDKPDVSAALSPRQGGTVLKLSQTGITSFLRCPYSYFSSCSLNLRNKKDATPSMLDDGTFLHYVFEHFLCNALQNDGTLKLPTRDEIEAIADGILEEYLGEVCPFPPELLDSRLIHLFARLRKLAVRMLYDMLEEFKVSLFVPSRFEQVIGKSSGMPSLIVPLNNGNQVHLTGKIDRIDFYKMNGKTVFRVIDYKTGEHKFRLADVKTGKEIQLVLYLCAVLASDPQNLIPAGAYYQYSATEKGHASIQRSGFMTDDQEIRQAADNSEGQAFIGKLCSRTAEEISELENDMRSVVADVAERILSGETNKTPSEDACKFCNIRMHCDKAYHK